MPHTPPDSSKIRAMFGAIAGRYDRANTVLSAGIHHRWRREAVRLSGAKEGDRVLDCATGTGDLAIAFREAVGTGGVVVGTDFVPEMIAIARTKAPGIRFEAADVMALPFDDASFDVASIAFGIRNVSDPAKGLAEMARVIRPGGRVVVLEFGQPPNRLFRRTYDAYRTRILPLIGGFLTGHRDAYEYLDRSSSQFPSGEPFADLMRASADFVSVDWRALTLGIAYVYRGVKR